MDTELTGGVLSWQTSVDETSAASAVRGLIQSILNPSTSDSFQQDIKALFVDSSQVGDSEFVIDKDGSSILNKGLTSARGATKIKNSELLSSREKLLLGTIAKTLKLMTNAELTRRNLSYSQKEGNLMKIDKDSFLAQFNSQLPESQENAKKEVEDASRANSGPLAALQNALGTVLPIPSPKKRLEQAIALSGLPSGVPTEIVLEELEEAKEESQPLLSEQRQEVAAAQAEQVREQEFINAAEREREETVRRLTEAAEAEERERRLRVAAESFSSSRRSSVSSVGSGRFSSVGPRRGSGIPRARIPLEEVRQQEPLAVQDALRDDALQAAQLAQQAIADEEQVSREVAARENVEQIVLARVVRGRGDEARQERDEEILRDIRQGEIAEAREAAQSGPEDELRSRIAALEAENQELRQYRDRASREMEQLILTHARRLQDIQASSADMGNFRRLQEELASQSEQRLEFQRRLLLAPDAEENNSRITALLQENDRLSQQLQALTLQSVSGVQEGLEVRLPSLARYGTGVQEGLEVRLPSPARYGNGSLFLSPEPEGNLDTSSSSILSPAKLSSSFLFSPGRLTGQVERIALEPVEALERQLLSPILEVAESTLGAAVSPITNVLPSIPNAPRLLQRTLRRVPTLLNPQTPSSSQLEEVEAFLPSRPSQMRSAITRAVAQAQEASALATASARSREARVAAQEVRREVAEQAAEAVVDTDVEKIARASEGDETLIEILDLTARALHITGPSLTSDQLELLREKLRSVYNRDRGQTLQHFGKKLFGEAGKNFFLDPSLANEGVAFLTPNMQRRFLLNYQKLPVEDSYDPALDNSFQYTQARFEY
jgi:hypothetical protein